MRHILIKAKSVTAEAGFVLRVRFADGAERTACLEPALHGDLFGPLRDEAVFCKVTVDPEVGAITWPNGADMDPSLIYQWDELGEEFCKAMQQLPESASA